MNPQRIRSRSRFLVAVSILLFTPLLYRYAQLEFHLPNSPAVNAAPLRGRLITEDGSVLAQSLTLPDGSQDRRYPQGRLAGALIGVLGTDEGLSGLERSHQQDLQAGRDVILTLQPWMQASLEAHLDRHARAHLGVSGAGVILETHTGKILAAASWPPFEPARWRLHPRERWKNRPLVDSLEPGSVIKALTVASLLDQGLTHPEERFDTPMTRRVGRHTLHDAVSHPPSLTTREILRYSSNVGMSLLIERVSSGQMHRFLRQVGFGQDTPLDGLYAEDGVLHPHQRWSDIQKANISFGQGFTANTLQVAAAFNVLANDGRYVPPHLVTTERVRDHRQVISPQTSQTMREVLRRVVEDGIQKNAGIHGYGISGKSSTAQVVVNGRYSSEVYNSLFAGFFPSNHPKVTVVVMVHGAQKDHYGSQLAAPIFRDVAADLMSQWGLPPEAQEGQGAGR